jgi:hypothetical protein
MEGREMAKLMEKMRALAQMCNSASAGSERFYAKEILAGAVNEILCFSWAWQLYTQNDVDRRACTLAIQKAAGEALIEMAPLILRSSTAAAFHPEARRVINGFGIDSLINSLR